MIIDFFLVFMILAWMREHGRAVRLENLCRRCIEDLKRFESKEKAIVEPAPVKAPVFPQCTMCSKRLPVGTPCGWLTMSGQKKLIVCQECATRTHAMLR